jgi:hypothetical protein
MSGYSPKVVDSDGNTLAGISAWKKQLITNEDPMHIHKTLGMLCMLSYVFRLAQTGPSDMGFASYPALTIPTVILHLLLNITSLVFKIPARRISSGYRIWPEYRLHSLVFLARSLAVMVLFWYEQTFHKEPNYDFNLAIIILGLVAADLSSYSQRQYQSSTIRDLDTAEWVKFLFSLAQFCGSANILYGLRYRYSMHMLSVTVVQCNAFMMTIRRKNLASHAFLVTIYGLALAISMIVCIYEYYRVDEKIYYTAATIAQLAVLQRMAPIFPPAIQPLISNKYVVWMTVGLILRQARPWLETSATVQDVRLIYIGTFVPVWTLGWYKCFGPGAPSQLVVVKAE